MGEFWTSGRDETASWRGKKFGNAVGADEREGVGLGQGGLPGYGGLAGTKGDEEGGNGDFLVEAPRSRVYRPVSRFLQGISPRSRDGIMVGRRR